MNDTKMKIRHLNIEVTKRCNQHCFYCFNDSGAGNPAKEFTPAEWYNMLRNLQKQDLESIHLTGGEPFVYRYAVEIIAGAQQLGLGTSILTNGFRIPDLSRAHPEVFKRLVVAQISLDSMNAETHNRRRGYPQAYADAVAAIHALIELQVPLEVSCVVSNENLADVHEVAAFCKDICAGLLIRPLIATGRASTYHLDDAFAHNLNECISQLRSQQQVHIVTDRFHYVKEPSATDGFFTLQHNGRLQPEMTENVKFNLMAA